MMNKVKISNGLAATMILLSMFAGWQTLLIVTVLLLIFCDCDDKLKGITVRVIAFMAALTLIGYAWDILYQGIQLGINGLNTVIGTINYYLEDPINISKLNQYLISPVSGLLSFANSAVSYLIMFTKFGFVIATLAGKAVKDNFFVSKINGYVSKVVNYVSSVEVGTPAASASEPEMPKVQ